MLILVRVLIMALFIFEGYLVGSGYESPMVGLVGGVVCGFVALAFEILLKNLQIGRILGSLAGLLLGIIFANLLLLPLKGIVRDLSIGYFILNAIFGYGGLLLGLKKGEKLTIPGIFRVFRGQIADENLKVLDTSVIIDGRIAEVCEAGFLDGIFVVPQFILQELQHIADSPDPLKRARGRRGLDILHRIQKMSHITVRITDEDFPKIREVDSKLVALARNHDAKIITNDFNLNKVAELQGVTVLNINELANALKPVVLPGESMRVFVIKEGKEYNQGVAYLDDGTMVVVENGRKLIGKNAEVTVTSVLQTTAGRMIFSKPKEDYEREEARAAK